MRPLYLTTTLPYVNDKPHLGHALEFIEADCFTRYARILGREVFFNTGTDEHGQKIYAKALEANVEPQVYVDGFAEKFKSLMSQLNIDYTRFIRTTDTDHIVAAQEFWKRCDASGDIYKKNYSVKYCVGCEMQKTDSELDHGKCPLHPNLEIEAIEEENYFFRFSKYQKPLEDYLSREGVIVPESRRHEALAFVVSGLEDFSISRLTEKMSWGIPVPGDQTQVMYVWFDALANYVSTLGWPDAEGFKKFWAEGDVIQFAGKDQVRMQSLMWQAMLMSANIKTTDVVFYHGFLNSGGQKMSKSLGNVIDPVELLEEYGTEALRFFMLAEAHPYEDSDITQERLKLAYNAHLANGIGNLTSRVMKMATSYDIAWDALLLPATEEILAGAEAYKDALNRFRFDEAFAVIRDGIAEADGFIEREEPFKKIKIDADAARRDVAGLVESVWKMSALLTPFMPMTAEKIQSAIKTRTMPESLFARKD